MVRWKKGSFNAQVLSEPKYGESPANPGHNGRDLQASVQRAPWNRKEAMKLGPLREALKALGSSGKAET